MAKKSETYEGMLEKLQEIVEQLESNELDLEKSMKNYEEGIKLTNKLYAMLNSLEGKIKVIGAEEESKE